MENLQRVRKFKIVYKALYLIINVRKLSFSNYIII